MADGASASGPGQAIGGKQRMHVAAQLKGFVAGARIFGARVLSAVRVA
jgi:hypothetical protein